MPLPPITPIVAFGSMVARFIFLVFAATIHLLRWICGCGSTDTHSDFPCEAEIFSVGQAAPCQNFLHRGERVFFALRDLRRQFFQQALAISAAEHLLK